MTLRSTVAEQAVQQARGAMEHYLDFFRNAVSASPWAGAELEKQVTDYAQQNVVTAFWFAQKLTQAKDLRELVRIQTQVLETQLISLTYKQKTPTKRQTWQRRQRSKGIEVMPSPRAGDSLWIPKSGLI